MTLILLAISLSITLYLIAYKFRDLRLTLHGRPHRVPARPRQRLRFFHVRRGRHRCSPTFGGPRHHRARLCKEPGLRFVALAIFAVPSAIAGYALVYGVTKNAVDSTTALNLLGGAGGLLIGIAAMLNLKAIGTAVLSR